MQQEVVFLFGPPCSGKELFYTLHFSKTHKRISPQELFQADLSLGLRAVILNVVAEINKGQSVVVDDENSSKKTRRSFISVLKKKVPHCTYWAVHFHVSPDDGLFICQWAREWELAQQFECISLNAPFKGTAKDVEHWFDKKLEPPDEEEGFHKVIKVEVQLICNTPFKFVVPALVLQWEVLFQDGEQGQSYMHELVADVIDKWSHSNPCGRVIVLRLSEKQLCDSANCVCVEEMKQVISELVVKASIPVFFAHVCALPWKFERPPNPGLFAWLQRLHGIDLFNRATCYMWSSDSHHKAAVAAGVKCFKAGKLLNKPQMVNAVHCGLQAQVPECIGNAKLVWSGSHRRPSACVPLFHRAVSSHNSADTRDITVTINSFFHGVCFKDMETFQRYNSRYQQLAIPTEPASKDVFNFKDCQSSEQKVSNEAKATEVSADKLSDNDRMDPRSVAGPISPRELVEHLTLEDIENLAHSVGHFKRGEGCVKLIRTVSVAMEQDGMLFSAKCLGSQGQLYDVSALLSDKGVLRASCSCADPASKLGKCKHSVGLLLWCKNENNVKGISKPSCSSDKRGIGLLTETKVKSASSDGDVGKRTRRDESSLKKVPAKRMKTQNVAENTLYCLSPDELLQTAEEILRECRCSLGEGVSHIADQIEAQGTGHKTCGAEENTAAANQPYQTGDSSSGKPTYLIKETLIDERQPASDSTVPVIPETVAIVTVESHSNERRLGLNEPMLRSVATCNNDQSTQPDVPCIKERGQIFTASILDDFI